ncbi:energy transducer TonB [Glycocaulis profundi]|nr:energy transducer TonB [Glycocaulis profundi]
MTGALSAANVPDMRALVLIVPLVLSACAANPLSDPRERGPFIAQSQMPLMPNVGRAAPSQGCEGEPLSAASAPLPDYPARGWSRGLQGWSIVQFDVAQDGGVSNARIAQSVPGGSFDNEALRAMREWRFRPLSEGASLTGCTVMFEFVLGEVRIR